MFFYVLIKCLQKCQNNRWSLTVPCQPSSSSGINNVFAVDAEHEHCSVLSWREENLFAVRFGKKQF